jgi:hypothetical protein
VGGGGGERGVPRRRFSAAGEAEADTAAGTPPGTEPGGREARSVPCCA